MSAEMPRHRHSLLLLAPRRLAWVREDLPALGPREVLIETTSGAVSVGSELSLYCGTARSTSPPAYPRMTGYESVGRVLACGAGVRRHALGDRVVAFYGHRTFAVVAEDKALAVPAGISDAVAVLAILSCDAAKGVRKVDPRPDEPVLIAGAGCMGLLTLFLLHALGVRAVDVVEPKAGRREVARALGARVAAAPDEFEPDEFEPDEFEPDGFAGAADGYAVAFECSSRAAAFELLQARMRPDGRICVTADGNLEPLTLSPAFHQKELRVVGTSDGLEYQAHATWYASVASREAPHLERLFEARTTAAALPATFERLASGALDPIKVLVSYQTFPTDTPTATAHHTQPPEGR